MRRQLYIGIGILILFLVVGLFSGIAIENTCSPISQLLKQAGNVSAQGDTEAAAMLVHSAFLQWQKSWHGIAALADHTPMDEIDGLFAQAQAYAKAGAMQDFSASCQRLASLIDAVAEAHSLTWWNLV